MELKQIVQSQYLASLEMLKQAVEKCPDALWVDAAETNQFWQVAFHTLFFTHFYLHVNEASFVPWEKQREDCISLGAEEAKSVEPADKAYVLEYLAFCQAQVPELLPRLDWEAESGFYWLPFNKLELQFYSIRHIMQHTGELCDRLGRQGIEIDWVGLKK